jgi:hypothetical protein
MFLFILIIRDNSFPNFNNEKNFSEKKIKKEFSNFILTYFTSFRLKFNIFLLISELEKFRIKFRKRILLCLPIRRNRLLDHMAQWTERYVSKTLVCMFESNLRNYISTI